MPTRHWFVFLAGCLLSAGVAGAAGPSLAVGKVSGKAGTVVEIPITFNPGSASVSGLQFNIALPPKATLDAVTASPTLSATSKSVSTKKKANVSTIIVFGLNQNPLKSGDLLTAKLKLESGANAGTFKMPISNVVYTDPNGKPVTGGINTTGSLTVN